MLCWLLPLRFKFRFALVDDCDIEDGNYAGRWSGVIEFLSFVRPMYY